MFRPGLVLIGAALAGGCATHPPVGLQSIRSVELHDVPFFPQTELQCGPAALATVLADKGVAVTPADLAPEVYIEGLEGSLQAELLSATRRHGLIPYPIGTEARDIFDEIEAGNPVVVLQNLRLKIAPAWHYAVVVGFDRDAGRVILRSGTERRRDERGRRFLRSWRLADNWAFVAVRPGEFPAGADADAYLRALLGTEKYLSESEASLAYRRAFERWPEDETVLFAVATRRLSQGAWVDAETTYRALLARQPGHAAARNNLANALSARGCFAAAHREAEAALAAASNATLIEAIEDTLRTIDQASAGAGSPACPQ